MIAKDVSVTEAVRNFSDYVARVAYRHESFILCKGKKRIAELRPLPEGRQLGDLPALLKSLPHLTREEADDFARDIESAREGPSSETLRDPWAS